jgi:hypothetical protein
MPIFAALSIQANMVMILTDCQKRGLFAVTHPHIKAEHVAIERDCAVKIRNPKVDMSNMSASRGSVVIVRLL